MKPKVIVITGASDGVGKSAAELLVRDGHTVIIVGRDADKTKAVADSLSMPYYLADFSKLSEVRELAATLTADYPRIDVLVNNAGAIFGSRIMTDDGFELTHQVNYVASFLLTTLLLPTLIKSQAVVINTASIAAERFGSGFSLDDLSMAHGYDVNKAYGNSKVALLLFTRELDRRYRDQGINAVAFHPGNLATGFAKGSSSWLRFVYQSPFKFLLGKADVGGKALKWLVDGIPGQDWQSGEYYEHNALAKRVNPLTTDMDVARQLWDTTAASLRN